MKMKISLIALACALLLALTAFALAEEGPGGPGGPEGMHGGHHRPGPPPAFWRDPQLVQLLGLTSDQIKTLDDLEYNFHDQEITLRAEMEKAHLRFERAYRDGGGNDQEVLQAAHRLADVQSQMFILHAEQQLKVRKVLSAEQWKKLMAAPPPMHGGMQGPCPMQGHGGMPGPGAR